MRVKRDTDAIIIARNLGKQVKNGDVVLDILTGVDLTINRGESVAITGSSGSGKSTLLGLLAGLDLPTRGHVELDHCNLNQLSDDERAALRAKRTGFVFQSFLLMPHFTALENVMLPLEMRGIEAAAAEATHMLARMGLAERLHHKPHQLSGGEQQRVALARAFITHPPLLFADEPTGNLDTRTGKMIMDALFERNQQEGITLILVTHDSQLAARCQRQIHLEAGNIISGSGNT